jgi:hypothetical protein
MLDNNMTGIVNIMKILDISGIFKKNKNKNIITIKDK